MEQQDKGDLENSNIKAYGSPLHVSTIPFACFPHGRWVDEGREMLVGDNIILAPKDTCMAIGRSANTHNIPFVSFLLHALASHTELGLPALTSSHSCKISSQGFNVFFILKNPSMYLRNWSIVLRLVHFYGFAFEFKSKLELVNFQDLCLRVLF